MSKPFNPVLHKDILSLKTFQGSKNEASFKQIKASVMQKHNFVSPSHAFIFGSFENLCAGLN